MIGERVPLVDARERVTGAIEYVQNLVLPGMLHARVVRSPHAHARIVAVDVEAAGSAPGVVAILTPDDLRDPALDPWYGPFVRDQSPLAIDVVRYQGEPVVVVAAETEDEAAAAAELVQVRYDVLPAAIGIEAALAEGAPVIHPGPRRLGSSRPDILRRQPELEGSNLVHRYQLRRGDVEAGFAAADVIVERTYSSPAVGHVPFETHVSVGAVAGRGVIVWTSSQAPSSMAGALAGMLRLPVSDVRLIVPTLGSGYGAKVDLNLEPIVALLARKARRPVRLCLSRGEEFLTATKHAARVRIRTGASRDGRLVAHEAVVHYDGGAYARDTPEKILRGYASPGPYRVANVRVDSYGVYTNVVPACAFRGFGIPQVAWAHEQQMDEVAAALGMDPRELRARNLLRAGDSHPVGQVLDEDPHYPQLMAVAAERVGWAWPPVAERRGPVVRGRGLAAILKGMSSFAANAVVKLNADGSLNVLTSTVEMGQGSLTVLAQIAAHEAGLPLSAVRVSTPDTANTPYDMMTAASRSTNFMGRAIRAAVQDVKRQVAALAASQLEAAPADIEVAGGSAAVRGSPDRSLTFAQVVSTAKVGSLQGAGRYQVPTGLDVETGQGRAAPQWHPAVCGAEVDVDEETGRVSVTRLHVALYVGRMINPTNCELQVEGAALFGLGQAAFEELVWDEQGTLVNGNLADYMIPSFLDVPADFGETILETPGSIDVHGIGETPLPSIAPAIANAVSNAIGVRVRDLPITPEKVLRLIRERDGGS